MMEPQDVLKKAVDTYGASNQLVKLLEEMSELNKEICKALIADEEITNIEQIAEEAADVSIMLFQLNYIFPGLFKKVEKYAEAKIKRLEERMEKAVNT